MILIVHMYQKHKCLKKEKEKTFKEQQICLDLNLKKAQAALSSGDASLELNWLTIYISVRYFNVYMVPGPGSLIPY